MSEIPKGLINYMTKQSALVALAKGEAEGIMEGSVVLSGFCFIFDLLVVMIYYFFLSNSAKCSIFFSCRNSSTPQRCSLTFPPPNSYVLLTNPLRKSRS